MIYKKRIISFLLLISIIFFVSCKSSSTTGPDSNNNSFSVEILNIQDGDIFSENFVVAIAVQAGIDVEKAILYIDDNAEQEISTLPIQFEVLFDEYSIGNHSLKVFVYDMQNNIGQSDTVSVRLELENISFSVEILNIQDGDIFSENFVVPIAVQEGIEVEKAVLYIDNHAEQEISSLPLEFEVLFDEYSIGNHSLKVFVYDIRNNIGQSDTVSVRLELDSIPPTKPNLYPHIGDMGDMEQQGIPLEGVDGNDINDFNNGIDAVHGTQENIRLQWEHLVDNDLDYVNIYRYSFYDSLSLIYPQSTFLSSDSFIDESLVTFVEYHYFIEVFDFAGNSTLSDTVSYMLLDKAQLVSPIDGGTVNDLNDLVFQWGRAGSGELIDLFRVILYRDNSTDNYEEYEHVWSYDQYIYVNENQDFEISYRDFGGDVNIPNGQYLWRVDALRYNDANNTYFGSESVEYKLYYY